VLFDLVKEQKPIVYPLIEYENNEPDIF
jgi:hypothetical protein